MVNYYNENRSVIKVPKLLRQAADQCKVRQKRNALNITIMVSLLLRARQRLARA
jgi:hypothetical protein